MTLLSKETMFAVGRPLGPLYSQIMKFRDLLYQHNVFKKHRLEVPVISVGNLTMGGTGKTPLVIYLAKLLQQKGYRPAIISRGYRGRAREPVNIVADGTGLLLSPEAAGDEPFLTARRLPGVIVATGKKRIFPCREVIKKFGCNAIILDDGFQHLSVVRTIDLVLFDVHHFAGNSRVFPGGELREPISALQRCSAILLTGSTETNRDRADKCTELLLQTFPGKPVMQVGRTYSHIIRYSPSSEGYDQEIKNVAALPENLFGFCGIGHPERFLASLAEHAIVCRGFQSYSDHYSYTSRDLLSLHEQAEAAGASGFLTTEKDMAKLLYLTPGRLPLFVPVLDIPQNSLLDTYILDHMS